MNELANERVKELASCILLGAHGYEKKMVGNKRLRGWIVYQRNTEGINANKSFYAKS